MDTVFSDNLIHKICKQYEIKSLVKHYQWKKSGDEHEIYANKINNNWDSDSPLKIMVSDMTNISYKGRKCEWTYILDTYNNSIIASAYSFKRGDSRPYYNCLEQLKEIIKKEEITHPIYYHTDQGSVYSSRAYNLGMTNYNIERSMSRAGTPTDNPSSYDSIDDFFEEYIYYFNHKRPSHKLQYKNPYQFTAE